jgi:hypothetical protein
MNVKCWWESQKERDQQEDQVVGGKILLKWILETRWIGMAWIDLAQDRDLCEHGSIKCWEVLE